MPSQAKRIALLERALGRAQRKWTRAKNRARAAGVGSSSSWRAKRSAQALENARADLERIRGQLDEARREASPPKRPRIVLGPPYAEASTSTGKVSLSRGDFESLREAGMSVTQARRVVRYRETNGQFQSVDQLDDLPGFPEGQLEAMKPRLVP